MKTLACFLLSLIFLLTALGAGAQTSNTGFEDGDFGGWQLSNGKVRQDGRTGEKIFEREVSGSLRDGHRIFAIGEDSTLKKQNISLSTVYWGKYSARIGNKETSNCFDKISRSFFVTSDNSLFQYSFAIVLEEPSHPPVRQPAFMIRLLVDGRIIPCGNYEVTAGKGIPGFQNLGSIIYRDWTVGAIDLRGYIGKNITIEIITHDCLDGGHWGYAYFDSKFDQAEVKRTVFCAQDSTMTLTAPEGFESYQWSTGDTTQSIQVRYLDEAAIYCYVTPFASLEEDCMIRFDYKPTPYKLPEVTVRVCERDSFEFGGKFFTPVKSDTMLLAVPRPGLCDSLVNVLVTLLPLRDTTLHVSICEKESYPLGGKEFNASGAYSVLLKSSTGCDSLVSLHLTVVPFPRAFLHVSICEEDSYVLADTLIRTAGTYVRTVKRANACDSIVTATITIIPLPRHRQIVSICKGDTLRIGEDVLRETGIYTSRVVRSAGLCDSIVVTDLRVLALPSPLSDLPSDHKVILGDSLTVPANVPSEESFTYTWTSEYPLTCDTCHSVSMMPQRDSNLSLTINKGTSCETSSTQKITVKLCNFQFPNAVTPNNDGINDDLVGFGGKCINRIGKLELFNRWGEKVLVKDQIPWNVSRTVICPGEVLKAYPEGTYYYVMAVELINGTLHPVRGSIRLLK